MTIEKTHPRLVYVRGYMEMNLKTGSCPSSRTVRLCPALSIAILYGLVKLYDPYDMPHMVDMG